MTEKIDFAERCRVSEQCLPASPYRDRLTALHKEMLDALNRKPLSEAQITFLHDISQDGDYLDFARMIEAKHGIVEIAKVCPECGSEDVTIMTQTENGEIVCAADVCQECGHQWNVG